MTCLLYKVNTVAANGRASHGAMTSPAMMVTSWRRHQMEIFSALLAPCVGNSPVTGEFPSQRPVTQSFGVFFDLRLNNRLSNNREADDLRRHRPHYDIIVMLVFRFQQHEGSALQVWNLYGQPRPLLVRWFNFNPSMDK